MKVRPRYPGIRVTANGNQLVSYHTEARIADAGVFYPITPSTEGGELYQQAYAEGKLNVFGQNTIAIEAEGEHAAQGGAIAHSVCGKRVVNYTSGQGVVYGVEQYYHAPGKCSTMVLEVAARALTKHALNVHCGHDDVYGALDTGWIIVFGKDAQQTADQSLILRRITELSLTPGMNVMDGFLTSHLERTFYKHESPLIREYLGAPDRRHRVPHREPADPLRPDAAPRAEDDRPHQSCAAGPRPEPGALHAGRRRSAESTSPSRSWQFFEEAYKDLRRADRPLLRPGQPSTRQRTPIPCSSRSDRRPRTSRPRSITFAKSAASRVGSIHPNVFRPFPEAAIVKALAGKKNVIILERTDEPMAGDNPMGRDIRTALNKALQGEGGLPTITAAQMPRLFAGVYGLGSRDFRPEHVDRRVRVCHRRTRAQGRQARPPTDVSFMVLGVDHPVRGEVGRHAVAAA